jgi:hypothetical protein
MGWPSEALHFIARPTVSAGSRVLAMAAFPNSITDVQYKTEPDFSHSTRFTKRIEVSFVIS